MNMHAIGGRKIKTISGAHNEGDEFIRYRIPHYKNGLLGRFSGISNIVQEF